MPTPALDPEFAALLPGAEQAAPAQAPPQAAQGGLEPEFAALLPSAQLGSPTAPGAAPAASGDTAMDWAKNLGSAAVRPIVKGVTAIPGVFADAAASAYNLATGKIDFSKSLLGQDKPGAMQMPTAATEQLLNQYTRQPEGLGKVAEGVNTALVGAALPSTPKIGNVPDNFVAPGAKPPSGLTGAQQQALAAGRNLGMQVTPGQAAGSKVMQQIEAKLESQPWTSGPLNALKENNQAVLDRQWAQAIGENSHTVDASVLGRANDRLGAVFQNVRNVGKAIPADPQNTSRTLAAIDEDMAGLLPNNASIRDNPLVKTLEETLNNNATIDGRQLGSLSSKLGKAAYKQMSGPNGDRDLGKALYAVKDHVDDLVQQTLSPAESQAYAEARQQYRSLMQLTARVGNVNPSTGHVSGPSIANYLQQTDKKGFLYGGNQSGPYEAARFAQAFKPIVGDSGTATRSANWLNPMEVAMGLPANLGTRLYLSRPGQGLLQGTGALLHSPKSLMSPTARRGLLTAEASESNE